MRTIATVLLLASLAMGRNVKDVPTVDQCRADQQRWTTAIEDHSYRHETITTIEERTIELTKCSVVDLTYEMIYLDAAMKYSIDEGNRLRSFLKRHHLADQFKDEDAAGKR